MRHALHRPIVSRPDRIPLERLAARFDANIGATAAQWNDISGNGRHLLQGTPGFQPTIASTSNGPCVRFDGTDDFMKCASFTLAQPETIYIVMLQDTWTPGEYIYDGNAINTMVLQQNNVSPELRIYAGTVMGDDTGLAVDATKVVTVRFSGTTSRIRVNLNTPTVGDAGTGAASGFCLGAAGNGSSASDIDVHEVLIYTVAHDPVTESGIIKALMEKWHIS